MRLTSIPTTLLMSTILAGCMARPPIPPIPSVNENYRMGDIDVLNTPVPTLKEIIDTAPSGKTEVKEGEDRLRKGAMEDAAKSYGARAGLAWESRSINLVLKRKSDQLTRTFDFNKLMIKTEGNVAILPPVISEARETWETSEAGRTLRVADTSYEIVEQAHFTATPPIWQSYLIRNYKAPEVPPDSLLPNTSEEKENWAKWVKEGWDLGKIQAADIFKADMERLERDYTGMARYAVLLEQKKVSAPVVLDAPLGTTGSGQNMRVNDRAVRITQDPSLVVEKPKDWEAAGTRPTNNETTTGVPTTGTPVIQKPGQTKPTQTNSTQTNSRREQPKPQPPKKPARRAWDDGDTSPRPQTDSKTF